MIRALGVGLALLALAPACRSKTNHAPAAPRPDPAAAESWPERLRAFRVDTLDDDLDVDAEDVPLLRFVAEDRPTVLAFWATYCPPCIEEMPMFDALHREGHPVVGVSMDAGGHEKVRALLERRGVSYPQVILQEASMKAAGAALDAGLPFTLVIRPDGAAWAELVGKTERREVLAAIETQRP